MLRLDALCLFIFLIIAIFMGSMMHCVKAEEQKIVVMVSVDSLASIVREIAGSKVQIEVLIPEGAEPHSYQISPETIEKARNARLFVFTGHLVFENKLHEILPEIPVLQISEEGKYGNHQLKIFTLPDGLQNLHGYWLYPDNALAIATAVAEQLSMIDPANARYYFDRLSLFKNKIKDLKSYVEYVKDSYNINEANVIITFPGEQYIAKALGLNVVAMLSRGESIFASGSELINIKNMLENKEAKLIISSDIARMLKVGEFVELLSKETSVPIVYVKVINTKGLSYFDIMSYNVGVMIGAFTNMKLSKKSHLSSSFTSSIYVLIFTLSLIATIEGLLLYLKSREGW